jgi:hypothetical protein
MSTHIRLWIVVSAVLWSLPLKAQEWIYCPAAPAELAGQCSQSQLTIRQTQDLMDAVSDQMHSPEIILAKVERRHDESLGQYQARVKQQQGVASPSSNHWLPIRGRYFDPDREIMYVALDRQDYWHYIWEALEPDEDLARRTFTARERNSDQFKQARFTGPGGKLVQWQQEIEAAKKFYQQCCQTVVLPESPTEPELPGNARRP